MNGHRIHLSGRLENRGNSRRTCQHLRRDGRRRFHLDDNQSATGLHHKICFRAMSIPIKKEPANFATIRAMLHDFTHNPAFEQCTTKRVRAKVLGCADSQQPAGKARVVEMQLRHFHETLHDSCVEGRQSENDKTGLKNREPCLCRWLRDAGFRREGREIQELPCSARAQLHGRKPRRRPSKKRCDVSIDFRPTKLHPPAGYFKVRL